MEQLDRYLSRAKEKGIDHAVVIETSKVYTAPRGVFIATKQGHLWRRAE